MSVRNEKQKKGKDVKQEIELYILKLCLRRQQYPAWKCVVYSVHV